MPCAETEDRLQAYFDGELDALAAAAFEAHLRRCAPSAARRSRSLASHARGAARRAALRARAGRARRAHHGVRSDREAAPGPPHAVAQARRRSRVAAGAIAGRAAQPFGAASLPAPAAP